MTDINIVILLRAGHITQYNANRAADEIERLRAALRNLLDMDVSYKRGPKVEEAVEAARAVLRELK